MKLKLRTFQIGTPRRPGEGLRLATARFLPRGVKKADYARLDYFDLWLPLLAPSQALVASYKAKKDPQPADFAKFAVRYRKEMSAPDPRHVIALLAEIAKSRPIAIGCYCPDERFCHRSVLHELIAAAARHEK